MHDFCICSFFFLRVDEPVMPLSSGLSNPMVFVSFSPGFTVNCIITR